MKYYQYNQWETIDDNIDYSQGIQTTSRIDDAFETCTFKAYLENNLPIPPYTLFKDGSTLWVGCSRITQYLTESDLYVHEFELLEPSAFLKCFIIGVKVYSKESPTWSEDSEKVKSLLAQAQRMYPDYTFDYGSIANRITTSKTYTFSATDTLYDCLNQICQENDVKLVVTFENDDPYKLIINFKSVVYGTYNINDSGLRIINHTENQDAENYGRYLETYASNVVDRTTLTYCSDLELKAADALLNADTARIELPTPIEEIVDFGMHQTADVQLDFSYLAQYFPDRSVFNGLTTYGDFAGLSITIGGEPVYIFEEFYEQYLKKYTPNVSKATFYSSVTKTFIQGDSIYASWGDSPTYGGIAFNIPTTIKCLCPIYGCFEKSQWDVLTPQQQSTYCVYTIGNNVIENLNASYKSDMWNTLIGESRGNFLSIVTKSPIYYNGNARMEFNYGETYRTNQDIFAYHYFAFYHPITNPYIRNKKTDSSYNEYNFKPISRSYGVSANYIDFDKIIPNMTISNNTLGQIEKVYEVDLTGVTDTSLNNPQAGNTVTISSGSWYISSCIRTKKFSGAKDTALLTIVKNYSKKADSIGVDSQEESTNNPLKGITTRPIYMEYTTSDIIADIAPRCWFFRFTFYDTNDNVITNTDANSNVITELYSRCSTQVYGNYMLCYAETLDQIIFMFGRGTWQSGYFAQLPFVYTSGAAETGYVKVELGTMGRYDTDQAGILLPVGEHATFTSHYTIGKIRIDKDAREHLTFSIMIKHS